MSTTVPRAEDELGTSWVSVLDRRGAELLFSEFSAHWLGEPRMGGREGGVNRPDLEWRRGEDLGEMVQGWDCGGDTVHEAFGGELPQAELLLPLLVRRRWGTGGVPMENWIFGGDIEITSGVAGCGAETRRDLLANCFVGERGEETGELRDVVR